MPASVSMSFYKNVSKRMAQLGISQTELGEKIGASQNSVSRLLRGRASLSIDQIVPLERALGWPWGTVARELGLAPEEGPLPGDVAAAIKRSGLTAVQRRTLLEVYHLMLG